MAPTVAIDNIDEQDSVWCDSSADSHPGGERNLIYFVPGNPCLMAFYKPFLYELFKLLNDAREPDTNVSVGGFSLPGFELLNSATNDAAWSPNGLEQQVANVERLILRSVRKCQETEDLIEVDSNKTRVVLVAHSVGAYMVLEALRRRAEGINDLGTVDIAGAVLLFPTVTEIAKSWHGSVMSV
jgi:Lipid-droplet associated hydrolase